MQSPDVNVLLYAFRSDSVRHDLANAWLQGLLDADEAYSLSDFVCSAYLRIATDARIFNPPSLLEDALTFLDQIRSHPNCASLTPGNRHWEIFVRLCRAADAKGKLVPDAYLAALAIESGSEWITFDGDYARFPGLRWRRPST